MILIQGYEWSRYEIEQMTHIWKSAYPSDLFIRWGNERILINHEVPKHEQRDRLYGRFFSFVRLLIPQTADMPRLAPEGLFQAPA